MNHSKVSALYVLVKHLKKKKKTDAIRRGREEMSVDIA